MEGVDTEQLENIGKEKAQTRSRQLLSDYRKKALNDSGVDTSSMTEDEIEEAGKQIIEQESKKRLISYYRSLAETSGITFELSEEELLKLGKKLHEENSKKTLLDYYKRTAVDAGITHGTDEELCEIGKNIHSEQSKERLQRYHVELATNDDE